MIALAQHCSKLKKLKLTCLLITATSLIALSERGLPLEELDIPEIPIPCAEVAAQCAYALSRIQKLSTYRRDGSINHLCDVIQYISSLYELCLNNSTDNALLSQLLQHEHFSSVRRLHINYDSNITPVVFSQLLARCPQLSSMHIEKRVIFTNTVLVELARSCLHLLEVTLFCEVTEEDVLALTVHCRQLQKLTYLFTTLTMQTVEQIIHHCPYLIELNGRVYEKEGFAMVERYKTYASKEIRAMRDRESSHANEISCLLL